VSLLPPWARRPAVGLVAACAVLVAVGAARYHGERKAGGLDETVDDWLFTVLGRDRLSLYGLLHVADLPVVVTVLAVVAVTAVLRRRFDVAALAAIGPLATILTTEYVLKPLVGRRYDKVLSYPSGHTVGTVSECATLGVILLGAAGLTLALRVALGVLLAAVCGIVMLALIVDGFHYFTDTVAGLFLSVGVVTLVALGIETVTGAVTPRPVRVSAQV
jgi:undecaprenyl-diphosphatase